MNESNVRSIRLNSKQKELVDNAAKIHKSSVSRFICDAAISKAVEIVNVHNSKRALHKLAEQLAEHILNPKIIKADDDSEQLFLRSEFCKIEKVEDSIVLDNAPEEELPFFRIKRNDFVINQLKSAFNSCPAELGKIILEKLENYWQDTKGYTPTHSLDEYLSTSKDSAVNNVNSIAPD